MRFPFPRRKQKEEAAKPDYCCPVCGVSFAMYGPDDSMRRRMEEHIGAFHPGQMPSGDKITERPRSEIHRVTERWKP